MDSLGVETKRYSIPDGTALLTLRSMGIVTGIVTAEKGPIVENRAKQLKIDILSLGCEDKLDELKKICRRYECDLKDVAFIGDDLNDYESLCAVGFAACPADAQTSIRSIPGIHVMSKPGGYGAIRECAELIVGADQMLAAWLKARGKSLHG